MQLAMYFPCVLYIQYRYGKFLVLDLLDVEGLWDGVEQRMNLVQKDLLQNLMNMSLIRENKLVTINTVHVKTKRYRKAKAQQTNQLHPGQLFFSREKEEMPWVGFEPTTLCSLGECSTS